MNEPADDGTSDVAAEGGAEAGGEPARPSGSAVPAAPAAGPGTEGEADAAPRSARVLVAVLFVLLLVPGVIGFDAWPLTGWRLFSLSRDADQSFWVLEAVDRDGERRVVSLEELPLRYRHAAWPMAELRGASTAQRDAVCLALLDPVLDAHPGTVALVIGRDHAELVERDGEWTTTHDIEPFHECDARLLGAGGGRDSATGEGS